MKGLGRDMNSRGFIVSLKTGREYDPYSNKLSVLHQRLVLSL